MFVIAGYVYLYVLPKGPETTQARPIASGMDSFVMYAYQESKRKSIKVWTYKTQKLAKWRENTVCDARWWQKCR